MVTQQKAGTLTLSNLITRFHHSRRFLSPRTQKYYERCLAGLEWFARAQDWPAPLEEITRGHIRGFLDYVADEPRRWAGSGRRETKKQASPGTVYHYGQAIKILFNWAEQEEYLEINPIARLKLGPPHFKEVEPYSDEQVMAILEACENGHRPRGRYMGASPQAITYMGIRNKAIISLFVATGLRLEELSGIRLSDLDPRLQQIRVMGKGAKLRVVPVDGEAKKALRRYLEEARPQGGDELWKTDDAQPMTSHSVKIMLSRLKKRAGVNSGGGAHRFRHYFATRYLDAGGDINSLRLLLGHATLTMVLRYSKHASVQRALDEHPEFNPLDRLYNGGRNRKRDDGKQDDGWGWKG